MKHLWHCHTQQVVQETRESAPLSILVMTQGVQVDIPGEQRATNKILFVRLSEITYNWTWKTSSNRNIDKVLKIFRHWRNNVRGQYPWGLKWKWVCEHYHAQEWGGGAKAKEGEGPIGHVGGILELNLHVRVIGRRQGPLFTIDCSKHSNFESLLLNNFFSNKARDFDISIQRFFKNYLL